jgi:hypothetical protein
MKIIALEEHFAAHAVMTAWLELNAASRNLAVGRIDAVRGDKSFDSDESRLPRHELQTEDRRNQRRGSDEKRSERNDAVQARDKSRDRRPPRRPQRP